MDATDPMKSKTRDLLNGFQMTVYIGAILPHFMAYAEHLTGAPNGIKATERISSPQMTTKRNLCVATG